MRLLGQRLKGKQIKQLMHALLDAFDLEEFDRMLLLYLDRRRQHLSLAPDLPAMVLDVIEKAEAQAWTAELLLAAREASPNNPELLAFAQWFGLASTPHSLTGEQLERTIKTANSELDVLPWLTRLGRIGNRICHIEINAGGEIITGTGFLLGGPDVVMTNYHVMERVIKGQIPPERVALRFDYKMLSDGTTLNLGTVYRLLEGSDWLIDSSPYSSLDQVSDLGSQEPVLDELDYALLRVQGAPGYDPVGGPEVKDPNAPPRGYIPLPSVEHEFTPRTSLFVLQHPDGRPLKLTLDTESVLGVNTNKTRVRYSTNTERGSSGSPCFSANWELIALHHSGDPNFAQFHKPQYNQGIPFSAILNLLKSRKVKDELSDHEPNDV